MAKLNPRRVPARQLDPAVRVKSFDEVELGYSLQEAQAEASRCIQCPRAPCVEACPAHNAIPDWIGAFLKGDLAGAAQILDRTSTFPSVCGRLCDQAHQCQGVCVVGRRGDPVSIGRLERYVADWALANGPWPLDGRAAATGRRVAVVGGGPAGLAAAGELARAGHAVTVFEQLPAAGGLLAWVIPSFRLPDEIVDQHVDGLKRLGVTFRHGERLGTDVTLDDLLATGFSAVFLAIGAWVPTPLGVPGEDLPGVYQALGFLARAKHARRAPSEATPPPVGRRTVVVGGGNTAMDAAQTARRLGAEVLVAYRRSAAEMPAGHEEVEGAEAEGVSFHCLTAPTRFVAGPSGSLQAVECIEMCLGEPGRDGRPRPVPQPSSEHLVEADSVVLALGFTADPAALTAATGLAVERDGRVVADPATGRTSRDRVWAAGDLVTGPDTVVRAMARGRWAAADIHRFLAELPS